MIHDPQFAEDIIAAGSADAVSIARAFLYNPRWAYHAAAQLGHDLPYPPQYERAGPAAWPPAKN
jgi:NADPH2 dehydrogenase